MKRLLLSIGLLAALTGCGSSGSSSSDSTTDPEPASNLPPTVSAGEDFNVDEQTLVNLQGTATDSDGSIASYQWAQTSGETVVIDNADSQNASFSAPETVTEMLLTFELTVTDNQGASASSQVNIIINPVNTMPVLSLLGHPGVIESLSTQVNVRAEDTDGEIVSYLWTQLAGIDLGLSEEQRTAQTLSFTAPLVEETEHLVFRVTVTDNENASASTQVAFELFDSLDVPAFNKLNDTGQTLCGNYTLASDPDEVHANDVDCDLTESPEGYPVPEGQDGHYGLDQEEQDDSDGLAGMRFLKLDQEGTILPADSEEWACVIDQNTGLTWEIKTQGPEITADFNRFTWYSADLQTNGGDVGTLNDDVSCAYEGKLCHTRNYWAGQSGLKVCGVDDWRLPTPKELFSLVSMKPGIQAKIDNNYFPNINAGNAVFWSATTDSNDPSRVFVVDFIQAKIYPTSKSDLNNILIVRSATNQ